jgi:hypothetical protein
LVPSSWRRFGELVAAIGIALTAAGCRTSGVYTEFEREVGVRALHPPPSLTCKDGRPVKLLVGMECAMGICGWTCAADRWREP